MSTAISDLIPELQPFCRQLLDAAAQAGMRPRLTSTRRSTSEQARLYHRFLAGLSEFPVAPPGHSAHEVGYAFDMVTADLDDLDQVGALWESWGGKWGGRIGDPIHFEFPGAQEATRTLLDRLTGGTAGEIASFLLPTPLGFQVPEEVPFAKEAAKIREFFGF